MILLVFFHLWNKTAISLDSLHITQKTCQITSVQHTEKHYDIYLFVFLEI